MESDLYLAMQALNLSVVDEYLRSLETDLLREYHDIERTPIPSAVFVSALSQLWVFGIYELMRTWRQRIHEVMAFASEIETRTEPDRENASRGEAQVYQRRESIWWKLG